MPIQYLLVARHAAGSPPVILAEHAAQASTSTASTSAAGFRAAASAGLERCPPANAKFTFSGDGHTYSVLVDSGFAYVAVAEDGYGRQIPFAALEAARTEFVANHAAKASTVPPNSLDRTFGPRLAAAAAHAAANPEASSRVAGLQRQVDEVKNVMVDNIEQVLARGERLEALVDKTDDLRSQADRFQRTGAALRRRMWWNNIKVWALIIALVLGLILVIALTACFSSGKNCFKKKQ